MTIKERYNQLANKQLTLEDFHEIVKLKNDCKLEMNKEYLYLCDLLIIDSYIEGNLLDDALQIAINSLNNIDSNVFKKIYSSFLERIIYICIQKKNYKSAYRFAFTKRNFIDLENIDQINRWYLEMAYIYAELDQTDKALLNLKAILTNYPDDYLKSLALSNLTKIYIDQKLISEAKETLSQCITLVLSLNDREGLLYCDYLNAKIYILENNFENARIIFYDLFQSIEGLPSEYFGIGNEYLNLLIEMEEYSAATRFIEKYQNYYKESDDLQNKKQFNISYLKLLSIKNSSIKDSVLSLINSITQLDSDIQVSQRNLIEEINEEDKFLEINNTLVQTISKIENTINLINLALLNDNERNTLMDFSKKLEKIIDFDEVLYVIFNKANFEILPDFFDNFDKVNTFEYKKDRLYERQINYNNLNDSILELLLINNNEMVIDFTDTNLNVKEVISGKSYLEKGIKSIVTLPLMYEKDMFAAVIFSSKTTSLINNESVLILKIACKLLESKLISLFYQESLNSQKNILQIAINGLQEGMFYYDPEKQRMLLTDQLSNFLGIHSNNYSKDEFIKLVHPDDLNNYNKIFNSIRNGEYYSINFRLITDNKEFNVTEQASPYINKDGVIKFYVGTINKINTIEKIREKTYNIRILNESDFNIKIESLIEKSLDLEYKFSLIKFKISNIAQFNRRSDLKDYIIEHIYFILNKHFINEVYLLDDDSFICFIEDSDQRNLEKYSKIIVSEIDKGLNYSDQFINLNAFAGYIRYPRDSHNIKELNNFTNLAINFENKINSFSEDLNKHYIKSISINKCIAEELNKNNLELLYLKLNSKEEISSYEVKCNINGIPLKETPQEYLLGQLLITFEKTLFNQLLKEIEYKENSQFYINMSLETLTFMLNSNDFKRKNILNFAKIIICIRNYSDNVLSVINQLKNLGFMVYLNYKIIKKIGIDNLLNLNINGVFINEGLEKRERVILLSLFKTLEYQLLTNYEYIDYDNIIYRTNDFVKVKEI